MTVPAYCCRCFSSHSTDSASRWLVGSSSRRMSGACSSRRQSATRRFSPPERMPQSVSPGGQRSASIAISSFESRSQAPAASSLSCTLPWRSISLSMSASGSPKALLISSNSLSRSMTGCTPCSTISRTVFVRIELRLLLEEADGVAGREHGLAEEVVVDAGQDAQQRRLARAVQTDDADLRAVEIGEVDVLEDLLLAVELRHSDHRVDDLVWFGVGGHRGADCSGCGPQTTTPRCGEAAGTERCVPAGWTAGLAARRRSRACLITQRRDTPLVIKRIRLHGWQQTRHPAGGRQRSVAARLRRRE